MAVPPCAAMAINRTTVATGVTLAALGGLTAVAMTAGRGETTSQQPAAAPAAEIRTETVHRTVRVRPKQRSRAARPAAVPTPRPAAPAPTPAPRAYDDDHDHGQDDDHSGHGRGGGHDDD